MPTAEILPEIAPSCSLRTIADDVLESAFGARFEHWQPGPWRQTAARRLSPSSVLTVILDRARAGGAPVAERLGRHTLLAIPFFDNDCLQFVSVATLESHSDDAALRTARLCLREVAQQRKVQQLQVENEAFALQMNQDFEELAYLRGIAERFQVAAACHDIMEMGKFVLPLLRETISAETVFLLSPASEDLADGHTFCAGPPPPDDLCGLLIETFGAQSRRMPVVKNAPADGLGAGRLCDVTNLILAPISLCEQREGWLLAINRNWDAFGGDMPSPWLVRHGEFGTCEAGMVTSTAAFLAAHAANVALFQQKAKLLTDVVQALVSAVEAKDEYTCGHSERVALFGRRLAEELGYDGDACQRLYLTGLLHDVGKIGISDQVLKKPGRLSEEEFDEIKRHPDQGWAILHDLDELRYVFPGVLYHHERYDGRGYPDGLSGDAIPLDGRILAVADAYDAMTSDRPYRRGMDQERAEAIIRDGAGAQWDPRVVDALFNAMDDIIQIRQSYRPKVRPKRTSRRAL